MCDADGPCERWSDAAGGEWRATPCGWVSEREGWVLTRLTDGAWLVGYDGESVVVADFATMMLGIAMYQGAHRG